jgi:transcriptional regulator GlxA family with amidase domain
MRLGQAKSCVAIRSIAPRRLFRLETTTLSIEQVASAVGFESTTTFRYRFNRLVGTNPHAYRRSFGH